MAITASMKVHYILFPIMVTPIDMPMNFDFVQMDPFMYICLLGLSK